MWSFKRCLRTSNSEKYFIFDGVGAGDMGTLDIHILEDSIFSTLILYVDSPQKWETRLVEYIFERFEELTKDGELEMVVDVYRSKRGGLVSNKTKIIV